MDHRKGFLFSVIAHMLLLTLLASQQFEERVVEPDAPAERIATSRVFMPPAEVLRQLAPQAAPAPRSRPAPTPPPRKREGKDRVSIGAPSTLRQDGPLELRRDDDLTKVAKGTPDATSVTPRATPPPTPPEPQRVARTRGGGTPEVTERPGLRLPPLGGSLQVPEGPDGTPGDVGPSIAESLREMERALDVQGTLGLASGTGRQMGPLFFDPQGADFTLWINHFKNEVYRNWLIPQSVVLGGGGEVKLQFSVARDGRMTDVRLLSSSGAKPLDRAARGALLGSLLRPLPPDYAPESITMRVTFYYGSRPPRGT